MYSSLGTTPAPNTQNSPESVDIAGAKRPRPGLDEVVEEEIAGREKKKVAFSETPQFASYISPTERYLGNTTATYTTGLTTSTTEDSVSQAASHYNALTRTRSGRSMSFIFHLRNLNNHVKTQILNDCASAVAVGRYFEGMESEADKDRDRERQRSGSLPVSLSVLDLACGKGGDYAKYLRLSSSPNTTPLSLSLVLSVYIEDGERDARSPHSTRTRRCAGSARGGGSRWSSRRRDCADSSLCVSLCVSVSLYQSAAPGDRRAERGRGRMLKESDRGNAGRTDRRRGRNARETETQTETE